MLGWCRVAVESMQSNLERWNSTDRVGTVNNNNYMKQKGDRSLLSQPSKVFARLQQSMIRYMYIVEPQLSENQFGFRKSKVCSEAIFNYKSSTLCGRNHFIIAFVDQEKAFDRIVRAELWKWLKKNRVF